MESNGSFSPLKSLTGRSVLLLGTTGFLGKVVLAMLLERFSVRRLHCIVRSTRSQSAADRFRAEVLGSDMMKPLRARFADSFDAWVEEQVEVHDGGLRENLGLAPEVVERLRGELDLVINSAGLVNFNPALDQALESNTLGADVVARFTRACDRAKLVHISTCFVAGNRSGRIREDANVVGWFPRQDEMPGVTLDWQREVGDLQRLIQQVRARTDDAALEAHFRQEALDRLKRESREASERTVRAALTNQRRRWVTDELIRLGRERAEHWGWPNIYTYSKALGEQAIASNEDLDWAIVRPAIVESALKYPFSGWNEGMNTTAPLALIGKRGQLVYPGSNDLILDVVPVDFVASATIAAGAALLDGEGNRVYQVAAGDVNPCSMARTVHLLGIYRTRQLKEREDQGELSSWKASVARLARPVPRSKATYQTFGAPGLRRLVSGIKSRLDELEPERLGSLGEFVHRAQKAAADVDGELAKVVDAFELFMPFIWEHRYVFRSDNTRRLFRDMAQADRGLLPFDTEGIDWRHYWLDVHLTGLETWVFPKLETQGPKRIAIHRDYRDLAELFDSRTRDNARRTAYRILRKDDVADGFTYKDLRRAATAVQAFLQHQGIGRKDRIAIASEGRPEWGMCFFGILLSGGTAVPLDVELSDGELSNIVRSSGCKGVIASDEQRTKLSSVGVPVWSFSDVFETAHTRTETQLATTRRRPEDVASIIFTSGTTGRPKGVMLTDRNFTALTARLSALFELQRSDALLSVLPPHHTFEFSAGLLMPLAAGASVTYLEERSPELIQRAFREIPVTGLIGVPAVWESLHRRIVERVEQHPLLVRWTVKTLSLLNRKLREKTGMNFGRLAFRKVHAGFGGRLRYLVSGGAALSTRVFNDLRGYGFSIYEGYGLTEAAPVLTVDWPRQRFPAGSVGWPLPGIDVRLHAADDNGIGEVVARGPTIMLGYLDDPDSTRGVLKDGWLHTGDLGRFDDDGRLYIVGRNKDVIIDANGKNVYPDEVEELYEGHPLIKELSVAGIPDETGQHERVAAMVHPDFERGKDEDDLDPNEVEERIRAHFREVGSRLPFARRVKVLHFARSELPRTSARKIRRSWVRQELVRLEGAGRKVEAGNGTTSRTAERVRRLVANVAQRPLRDLSPATSLSNQLGFDSLLQMELLNALEREFPDRDLAPEELTAVDTLSELVQLMERSPDHRSRPVTDVAHEEEAPPVKIPGPVARMGKRMLGQAQHLAYDRWLHCEVQGRGNIPANTNFIVASNHASHLDMGLAKYALGPFGRGLRSLAARDYFFDDPVRRTYFENFTNLLPMERHGSLRRSLELAVRSLRQGESLLIFPEGTRARDGVMTAFKPAVGYLCLHAKVDVLPIYLRGTHQALPVGEWRLDPALKIEAHIGPPIRVDAMMEATRKMSRSRAYRHVAQQVEAAVRRLGRVEDVATSDDDHPSWVLERRERSS